MGSRTQGYVGNIRCNWEATPPGYRACVRAWRWLAPHHRATPAQTFYGSPGKLENTGMLAAVASCGRSRKWCGRGRLALGFKPSHGSHAASFWDHAAWTEKSHDFYFFFWDMVSWTGQRGKKGLCVCGCSKGLWVLNEDIKLLLLNLYNSLNNPFPFQQSLALRDVFPWWQARRT